MSEDQAWTIGKLLEWTKEYLSSHGSDSARLDAEVLLAHARNCKRIELYTAFDEVASQQVRDAFRSLVKRRAEGMPVAYLVESREFYSLPFYVNDSVLIPRPETEFLVIRLLDLAKQLATSKGDQALRVVDVGTGSGVIAICAAIYLPECKIVAIDSSPEALAVARRNAETHNVADRIEFREGDLLGCCESTEKFDFVVSNPPYVSESEYAELDPQVKDYEPKQALLSGAGGTDHIEQLVPQAGQHLSGNGWLIMEISPMICSAVEEIIASSGKFNGSNVTNDLAKLARIIDAQRRQ